MIMKNQLKFGDVHQKITLLTDQRGYLFQAVKQVFMILDLKDVQLNLL